MEKTRNRGGAGKGRWFTGGGRSRPGRVGAEKGARIAGEGKIKPERARYWVCTVEAMPRDVDVDFLAIDEIQLAGDPERGHVFTDRLLHARGRSETLLLGAQTMRETIA